PVSSQGPPAPAAPEATRTDGLEITFPAANRTDTPATRDEEPSVNLEPKDTKLLLRLKARKSLDHDFYDTSAGLTFARTKPLDLFQNLALEARFDARNLPQGNGDLHSNEAFVGFSTGLHFRKGGLKLIDIDARYRWSRDQFFSNDGSLPNQISSEYGFESRTIVDGNIGGGLFRSAMWVDYGSINRNLGSYGRVAAMAGYGKEFVIRRKKHFHEISPPELSEPCWTSYPDPKNPDDTMKNEPTVGLELIVGGGRAWGSVPEYARFYGGNPPGQFLYDELSAQSLTSFPSGPQIRSLGQNEAGIVTEPGNVVSGGTSFWHASVNLSLPISSWSRPLIPHEWVTFSTMREGDEEFDGHAPAGANICRDLKATVKTLVSISGENLMVNQQARDMLTDAQKSDLLLRNQENPTAEEVARLQGAEEALARAKAQVRPEVEALFNREILPLTDFIADHANIISVKPLLMFDVAQLGLSNGQDNRTRYAAGGGLQLDIVMARFEFGYVAALNRAPGDPRGNFVGRLVLRRFF
ncbi:MAG: hypothetical protein ND895_26900, partial [Pyrinomonadaceae bacterium]|nr:hypothetical protein [Pyrinomonadaceae bacterium]